MSKNTQEFTSPSGFLTVIDGLPKARQQPLYTLGNGDFEIQGEDSDNPTGARAVETHQVVVNASNEDLFGVVTDEYEVIQPQDFLRPLVNECIDRGRMDLEGSITTYDGGASAYGEVLFDTDLIWPPERDRSDEPVRTGLTFRYSHNGGVSVRASGFAQDGACKNTMRQVTDSIYVKHAGDVDERVDWESEWSDIVGQLGVFSENLANVIEGSMEFDMFELDPEAFDGDWIETTEPPQRLEEVGRPERVADRTVRGLYGFYDYTGFPNYLSLEATGRLMWRIRKQPDADSVSAWDMYSAATYALTHEARFDQGSSSDDRYHRYASDILSNPRKALQDAEQALRAELAPDFDDQTELGVESTIGEAAQAYQEREQQLQESFSSD